MRSLRILRTVALGAAAAAVGYRQVVTGKLTLDTGIGRRTSELGPLTVDVDAPRELVFEVIAAPYFGNTGPAGKSIDVLERDDGLVVAAHHTATAGGLVAITVEAVGFKPPSEVRFRLLRGPVPHVTERFVLDDVDGRTRVHYDGQMGTDFWRAGELWGALVRRVWVRTVAASLEDIRERSEQRAAAHRRRNTAL